MVLVAFSLSRCSAILLSSSQNLTRDFLWLDSARLDSARTFSGSVFAAPASAYRSSSTTCHMSLSLCSFLLCLPITFRTKATNKYSSSALIADNFRNKDF